MRTTRRGERLVGLLGMVFVIAVLPASAAEDDPPAGGTTAATAQEPKADEKPDPFVVPDGSPERLLEYVEGLKTQRPAAADFETVNEFRLELGRALVESAEKILVQKATDEQIGEAVQLKMIGLGMLEQLGEADAGARLGRLPDELDKAGLGRYVRPVQAYLLQRELRKAQTAEDFDKLIGRVKEHLVTGPDDGDGANLAMSTAQRAERLGDDALAARAYRELGQALSASDESSLASLGKMMQGAALRLSLVGKEMSIEGVALNGEPFDWSAYKGKVVLVSFWATWCPPCRAEIPHIRKSYDNYHDRGFEVVAISLDDDREPVEQFVDDNELPWTVLFDADREEEPMSQRYGVLAIPVEILVDRDGKVVTRNARGPVLERELTRLIGPAEPEAAAAAQAPSGE